MEKFNAIVSGLLQLPVGAPCPDCGELWSERPSYPDGVRRVRVTCPHELAARDYRDRINDRNARHTRWTGFNAALLPLLECRVQLSEMEPTRAIADPLRRAKSYIANIDEQIKHGIGLYLHGSSGTGKTALATAIAAELDRLKITVCLLTSGQIIDGYKARDTDQFRGMIQSVEILIIDDLGSEGVTDFSTSKLFEAINDRYASNRPLIITSNYNPTALCERYSRQLQAKGMSADDASLSVRRLLSRIAERCDSIEFVGDDYRLRRRGWSLLSGGGAS